MKKKCAAFYTLEATWMFGLTLIVFFSILMLDIRLCHETTEDIRKNVPAEINAVSEFRKINMVKNMRNRETE